MDIVDSGYPWISSLGLAVAPMAVPPAGPIASARLAAVTCASLRRRGSGCWAVVEWSPGNAAAAGTGGVTAAKIKSNGAFLARRGETAGRHAGNDAQRIAQPQRWQQAVKQARAAVSIKLT